MRSTPQSASRSTTVHLSDTARRVALATATSAAALALGLAAFAAPAARAQDAGLTPTFGSATLAPGFGSSTLTIQAGGLLDAQAFDPACGGFIAEAPDHVITHQGDAALTIGAWSEQDTTIVVQAPGGVILCNDDTHELNPEVVATQGAGDYAIWVGTFEAIRNDTYPDAELVIAEGGSGMADGGGGAGIDANATPTFGFIDLTGGSTSMDIQAGGPVDAATVDAACNGFLAVVPDLTLQHPGGDLDIAVTSEADTTLLLVGPDGAVSCNDDAVDLNPGLSLPGAASGSYALFVGTFGAIENDFFPNASVAFTVAPATPGTGGGKGPAPVAPVPPRALLEPAFGATTLSAGFGTHSIEMQAGGLLAASDLDPSCSGFVAEAPDYTVTMPASEGLRFTATSEADTTLVVITPDGQVLCNDDYRDLNPGLVVVDAPAGAYAVWVGTFGEIQNDSYPSATLAVEEVSDTKTQPSGAITSTALTAGFTPDPFVTTLAAGGLNSAAAVADQAGLAGTDMAMGCFGYVSTAPDFQLDYTAGEWPLKFAVTSDADTTLLVLTPSGEVHCNDDFDGLNPAVAFTAPSSGTYRVWIGTYLAEGENPMATLAVTELLDEKVLPDGAVTEAQLSAGMQAATFDLLAGGSFDAAELFGGMCGGFVAQNPDFLATVTGGGFDVEMTVRSSEDTTLAVRTPSGEVLCDDDTGGDFNPLVTVAGAQPGVYEVWLGTYGSVGNAPATLAIRDANVTAGAQPNVPGEGKK